MHKIYLKIKVSNRSCVEFLFCCLYVQILFILTNKSRESRILMDNF